MEEDSTVKSENDINVSDNEDLWDELDLGNDSDEYTIDPKSQKSQEEFKYETEYISKLLDLGDSYTKLINENVKNIYIANLDCQSYSLFIINYNYDEERIQITLRTRPDEFAYDYQVSNSKFSETRKIIHDFEPFDHSKIEHPHEIISYLKMNLKIYDPFILGFVLILYFYMAYYKYRTGKLRDLRDKESDRVKEILKIVKKSDSDDYSWW